jgi:hypothetical protein
MGGMCRLYQNMRKPYIALVGISKENRQVSIDGRLI